MKTETSEFGTGKREGHDATRFYKRKLFDGQPETPISCEKTPLGGWIDQIYCASVPPIPILDNTTALAFTSPPYNVGKAYDEDMTLAQYLDFMGDVGESVYRKLFFGGRYVINIANLGRKPYIPLHTYLYMIHMAIGFIPVGEIIWIKGKGASGNCAWGSWKSAKAPCLRDLHEYLLVFAKGSTRRPDRGESDMSAEEFMQNTLSVWNVRPESAKRIGHPAPFPLELAERVIKLYSYVGDLVLDPFVGSGTTCVAAKKLGRHWVGVDRVQKYCDLAEMRLMEV